MTKTALITGVNGQDGAYLAKRLLDLGYRVVGGLRRTSSANLARLAELGIQNDVVLVDLDLFELSNVQRVLERHRVEEFYNLAAQSFVGVSFEQPLYTAEIDALGPLRVLEAIRAVNPATRFYQASTSEMFGKVRETPQSEMTPFHPRSPYGVAKVFAHWATINYRESYGLFAVSGILFNHESPLRGREFVTRKVTTSLAQVKHGKLDALELGNMDAKRDWGFAGDYVDGMRLMLQQDTPDDYVLATGETHTVRHFVEQAALHLGFKLEWSGAGENETGIDRNSGRAIVRINPKFYRPAEVELLIGHPKKAEQALGWRRAVDFPRLVAMMAEADERRVVEDRMFF